MVSANANLPKSRKPVLPPSQTSFPSVEKFGRMGPGIDILTTCGVLLSLSRLIHPSCQNSCRLDSFVI